MGITPTIITAEEEGLLQRVRNVIGAGFFLFIQRFPKFLLLYRNEQSWTLFRVAMGCSGAGLVVLPLTLWNGYFTALFGLTLFVLSIMLPPAELESATDRKARELGAQTVLSGGRYQPGKAPARHVQLFISSSQVWALDKHFEPLVVITTGLISSLDVVESENHWVLCVRWAERKAEFVYKGIFAERFARLAEESLRQANLATQPKPDKHRAAGA